MKNENFKLKIRSGFSLIEVVFAMSFLTIIILGVITLQSSNLAMMNRQNNEIQAHFLANQGLKIVEAVGTSECANPQCYLDTSSNTYTLKDSNSIELLGENDLFKRTISIEAITDETSCKVTAIIEWTDSTGPHTVIDGGHVEAKRIIF